MSDILPVYTESPIDDASTVAFGIVGGLLLLQNRLSSLSEPDDILELAATSWHEWFLRTSQLDDLLFGQVGDIFARAAVADDLRIEFVNAAGDRVRAPSLHEAALDVGFAVRGALSLGDEGGSVGRGIRDSGGDPDSQLGRLVRANAVSSAINCIKLDDAKFSSIQGAFRREKILALELSEKQGGLKRRRSLPADSQPIGDAEEPQPINLEQVANLLGIKKESVRAKEWGFPDPIGQEPCRGGKRNIYDYRALKPVLAAIATDFNVKLPAAFSPSEATGKPC